MNKNSKSKRIGLYITVIFHLTVIAFLMGYSLKSTIERTDEILLDMMTEKEVEELQKLEEEIRQKELEKKGEAALYETQELETIRNTAVDESGELKDDRNTDAEELYRQHEELMKEIREQQEAMEETADDEVAVPQDKQEEQQEMILPDEATEGAVTVKFNVSGRHPVHYRIPAYKCQNEGLVVVKIGVAPNGKVISAEVIKNQSDPDPCIQEAALRAAGQVRFKADPAAGKSFGTITYIFIRQY